LYHLRIERIVRSLSLSGGNIPYWALDNFVLCFRIPYRAYCLVGYTDRKEIVPYLDSDHGWTVSLCKS